MEFHQQSYCMWQTKQSEFSNEFISVVRGPKDVKDTTPTVFTSYPRQGVLNVGGFHNGFLCNYLISYFQLILYTTIEYAYNIFRRTRWGAYSSTALPILPSWIKGWDPREGGQRRGEVERWCRGGMGREGLKKRTWRRERRGGKEKGRGRWGGIVQF